MCVSCLAVHHAECWLEHGRCAGCARTRALMPPEVAVPRAKPEEPPPLVVRVEPLVDEEEARLIVGARSAAEIRGLAVSGLLPVAQWVPGPDGVEAPRYSRRELKKLRKQLVATRRRHAARVAAQGAVDRLLWLGLKGVGSAAFLLVLTIAGALLGDGMGAIGLLGLGVVLVGLVAWAVALNRRRGSDRDS